MPKKCPPGVICVENVTLFGIFVVLGIVVYIGYPRMREYTSSAYSQSSALLSSASNNNNAVMFNLPGRAMFDDPVASHYDMLMKPGHGYTTNPQDVLMNPYVPPVNMANNLPAMSTPISHPYVPPGRMPVNVSTSVGQVRANYSQVGILTPVGGNDKILALMGRQLHTSRQKWQYYTMSDNNNSVKLPVIKNGRSCTNEYGCDELNNGETVFVEGYNQAFRVTVYENDSLQYIPYL